MYKKMMLSTKGPVNNKRCQQLGAWDGCVRHREQIGRNHMKFYTKAKYWMLTTLIDSSLEGIMLPTLNLINSGSRQGLPFRGKRKEK